ncbi:hypothetical protein BD626DRAFT_559529 [Schizophyllum amplum]|uniref:Uncharacterized protein n=1 Tax=Schizophyllum amplum TaxID=97359 RepID=A0A550C497_9AGAR|nr:hypothetical protein BD626DRAFT_559529 [Auriculariopsis ampla]
MNRNHLNLNLTEELRRLPTKSQREDEPYDSVESPPPVDSGEDGPLEWDWNIEHDDRKREAAADATLLDASPFQVDRRVLKDVVREQMSLDVGRIQFLSAGTFHKAYLVTLVNRRQIIARVARRFMPRLKTESEVATLDYLRTYSNIPVPDVFYYDSNPYNRLGGEYILMSKAKGIPLSRVYHSLSYTQLVALLKNLAHLLLPLFAHRFPKLGSLYFGPDPMAAVAKKTVHGSTAHRHYAGAPFSPTLTPRLQTPSFHVGPIISWPFFGSNRGDLAHPHELDRGPWATTRAYLASCVEREVRAVVTENEGKSAPHRLHLDPDEIRSSRHHHLRAVPGDESDDSDEWDAQESDDEWEGPGDAMYRDYRRMQRSTFLIAHLNQRVEDVSGRWRAGEVFVDEIDHSKITCIIDWESTTTRPLWACTHMPAFLQASPFTASLFREIVRKIALAAPPTPRSILQPAPAHSPAPLLTHGPNPRPFPLAREHPPRRARHDPHRRPLPRARPPPSPASASPPPNRTSPRSRTSGCTSSTPGARLRLAHRFVEWDGWEEGLVTTILGPEDAEDEWFGDADRARRATARKPSAKLPFKQEKEKEQMLDMTGDICGGRGGELGRRLEAWLTVNGNGDGQVEVGRKWRGGEEEDA